MRIAVAGKGGAGKTTTSATLARLAARRGHQVVCIDADSNPNLAIALGFSDPDASPVLPVSIVSRRLVGGAALTVEVKELLDKHTVVGPDGVRMASMGMPGHAEEGCLCSAHGVVRATLADLDDPGMVVVVDLEASPEHFSRGTARHVDTLVFVAEPYFRSLETVRRMAGLAKELPIGRMGVVANKIRDPEDFDAIAAFCERHDLELLGEVGFDPAILDADRDRVPLVDAAPDGSAVAAYARLLDRLLVPAVTPAA